MGYKEWDFEMLRDRAIEVFKYFWSQPIVRRFLWMCILAVVGLLLAIEFVIHILGIVFYELTRLFFRLIGINF